MSEHRSTTDRSRPRWTHALSAPPEDLQHSYSTPVLASPVAAAARGGESARYRSADRVGRSARANRVPPPHGGRDRLARLAHRSSQQAAAGTATQNRKNARRTGAPRRDSVWRDRGKSRRLQTPTDHSHPATRRRRALARPPSARTRDRPPVRRVDRDVVAKRIKLLCDRQRVRLGTPEPIEILRREHYAHRTPPTPTSLTGSNSTGESTAQAPRKRSALGCPDRMIWFDWDALPALIALLAPLAIASTLLLGSAALRPSSAQAWAWKDRVRQPGRERLLRYVRAHHRSQPFRLAWARTALGLTGSPPRCQLVGVGAPRWLTEGRGDREQHDRVVMTWIAVEDHAAHAGLGSPSRLANTKAAGIIRLRRGGRLSQPR